MYKAARIQMAVAALFGLLAVISGALGAHALEDLLDERGMTTVWETAVLYHLAHAVALFALGIWSGCAGRPTQAAVWAGGFWMAGVVLFSGSLYLLALGGPGFLGPITPLGGVALILGWAAILVLALSGGKSPSSPENDPV